MMNRTFAASLAGAALLLPCISAAVSAAPVAAPATAPATAPAALPPLSSAQVVEKNVAARGGLAAWKAVQTMSWKGTMGAGGTSYVTVSPGGQMQTKEREEMRLPFTLEFKRPLKSRLELEFNGQKVVQVYDGAQGWKLRPYLGRTNWDAYSADELKQAAAEPGINGWLIDAAATGARVESAGTDTVEGNAAYKLKVIPRTGPARYVWVDGKSFLDVKLDGEPRKLDGRPHAVVIYQREFKPEHGLLMPHVLETAVKGVRKTEKIVIDSVLVNPKLDDAHFTKSGA